MKLIEETPEKRLTMNELKQDPWVTKNGEFILPDAYEDTLDYIYSITSNEISSLREAHLEEVVKLLNKSEISA
jgi:hypothetical protein